MRDRRVLCTCALVALLIAWRGGASPALAARDSASEPRTIQAAPQFEAGEQPKPQGAPGPSVLRGAGGPETAVPGIPGKPSSPTPTPIPTREPAGALSSPTPIPAPGSAGPDTATPAESASTPAPSLLAGNQIVVLYGLPGNADLGVLGAYSPEDAAGAALLKAAEYDAVNGTAGVKPMLDLVYAQAQAEPTDNGLYLRYLSDRVVRRYMALAERYDLQLMLDLQIGRGDPLDEVRKIERYLRNPRVHVAIDPEYAVGAGGVPAESAGVISGEQINAIQAYVASVVATYRLPPKVVVVHQYMEGTVTGGDGIRRTDNIDLVFNMDAFGALDEKARKYSMFSRRGYPARHGFNVFLRHDDRVMSAEEVLRLSPRPDVIFFQ